MGADAHSADRSSRRLFFALWPSDELQNQVARAIEPVLAGKRARPIKAANFHITLAFLGSVPTSMLGAVVEAADHVQGHSFVVTLDRVVSWRAARVACVMIDPIPVALSKLVATLRENLASRNIDVDRKEFKAHLTLAREWKDSRLDSPIGPLNWLAAEFALIESTLSPHGSTYRVIRRWPLSSMRE